jgi:hypothetical protein
LTGPLATRQGLREEWSLQVSQWKLWPLGPDPALWWGDCREVVYEESNFPTS